MGSAQKTGTRFIKRCCYGASFGFGFIVTVLAMSAMFWVAWCYFGLTIVHVADTQRRALVNYSFPTTKTSPTIATPFLNRTTLSVDETSINSISKSSMATSALRGSSRGESQVKLDKRKEAAVATNLAKGDFAARDRAPHNSNTTSLQSQDSATSVVSHPRGPPRRIEHEDDSREKASILNVSAEDDQIYARRVSPPGTENRPEEKNERKSSNSDAFSRLDISPTKVYDVEPKYSSPRLPEELEVDKTTRDDSRSQPRDYDDRDKALASRRDDIQSSRRSEGEPVYREPEFDRDREYPRRVSSNTERGVSRHDDVDDNRGSRSRYDRRDRGRDTDDRYSKGDTRVYPDDAARVRPADDDRYRESVRDRSEARRGDDDRYDDRSRDYDEKPRYRERDIDDRRYRDRDFDDKTPLRDDRLKDDAERYRSRDDDRYRGRDDERYRSRNDDRYRYEDDDRYVSRDDRYRTKDDERYVSRDDDRYRKNSETRRDSGSRYKDEPDTYRPKLNDDRYIDEPPTRDRDYREPVREIRREYPDEDRKSRIRPEYNLRSDGVVSDYDVDTKERSRSYGRESIDPPRITRPLYNTDRYRDDEEEYRRPSRPENTERRISPTRSREEIPYPRSTLVDTRSKEIIDDSRYADPRKESRTRDVRYDQSDRIISSRDQDSKISASAIDGSRRLSDDREEYRTRLPSERSGSDKREEVVLDRRSYASEEVDDDRRRNTRRDYDYDDRSRRLADDTRRYRDDERYIRRDAVEEDEYKRSRTRESYEEDRPKRRDRYDDDYRRYDDKYISTDQDRYIARGDQSSSRKYDASYDDDRSRRRDPGPSVTRKEEYDDRDERRRPSLPSRSNDERSYSRDEYPESTSSRRRSNEDLSLADSRDSRDSYSDDRRRSETERQDSKDREAVLGSSMGSVHSRDRSDVVIREKRYQNTDNKRQTSRVSTEDGVYRDRNYQDMTPRSREELIRPLTAKDVIEAAMKQSDVSDQSSRKVYYPVFDPRISNLTSPEIIRPSERRGTTITARRKRST